MTHTIARLSLAIFAAFLIPHTAFAGPDDKSPDKVFVGYLFGDPKDVDFKLYTHLCHAFLVADGEGKIREGRNVPDRELTDRAHKAGVRVLVSLGGWGWDKQFAAITANPEAEERYVKGVMAIVDGSDYDGIDLDWEYPDTEKEVVGFERLTRRFRKEIDAVGNAKGRSMRLTMAASSNEGTLKWLATDFLVETMDWVNVMTYDYTGDWTPYAGHHSPLHASKKQPGEPRSSESTIVYLLDERKLPAHKIALGIPLYGRAFPVGEPYASTKGVAKTRMPQGNYRNIVKLKDEQGWTRQWDAETQNPWLLSPDHKAVMGYDDVESVTLKTEWAVKKGLRGVFFWQVAADRLADGSTPLQTASRKALDAGVTPGQ